MDYEWDSAKAKANAKKHGVDFADAAIALSDDSAVTIPDPDSEDEERFVSLGVDPNDRVLVQCLPIAAKGFGSLIAQSV
jgi:uncharacterized protein